MSNHYSTLGLEPGCDQEAVTKAYRKLARQYHPDRNPGDDEAVEMFKLVQAAYEVLSDPGKRHSYDMTLPRKRPTRGKVQSKPVVKPQIDPNLGKVWDAPPPQTDLWGRPLSAAEQAAWVALNKMSMREAVRQSDIIAKIAEPEFKDVFAGRYESSGSPELR